MDDPSAGCVVGASERVSSIGIHMGLSYHRVVADLSGCTVTVRSVSHSYTKTIEADYEQYTYPPVTGICRHLALFIRTPPHRHRRVGGGGRIVADNDRAVDPPRCPIGSPTRACTDDIARSDCAGRDSTSSDCTMQPNG